MTKEDILDSLKNVIDPEINISLIKLKMIGDIEINQKTVTIELKLTTSVCPLKKELKESVTKAVEAKFPDVKVVIKDVEMSKNEKMYAMEVARKNKKNTMGGQKHQRAEQKADSIKAKKIIGIASGKGGVGKSTLTVLLAKELQKKGKIVGILDTDIYGYSVPKLFGIEGAEVEVRDKKLIPVVKDGIHIMSMGFLTEKNEAILIRGPLTHRLLTQFAEDVLWPKLDVLLIDLPPGTGDILISASNIFEKMEWVIISTPDENAGAVAVRTGSIVKKAKQKIIGAVENMSYLLNENGEKVPIFQGKGGSILSKELSLLFGKKVPLISRIPIVKGVFMDDKPISLSVELEKIVSFI